MAESITRSDRNKLWRRRFRRRRKAAVELGQQADQGIEKLLLRRFNRLKVVRRFVVLWLLLFAGLFLSGVTQLRSLGPYYQSIQPAPGGIYSEGLVGSFNNANPLYANGAADTAVSRLIFSGLFKYDQQDRLIGDLATSWKLDAKQTTYTVSLKQGVKWQDGQPFTSADAVFTYKTIQNTEAQSPLFSSWQDITVSAAGPYTVIFSLPNPLSSFPYALTNGIIPKHLLATVPPAQLRSANFNTAPVGTGPFQWRFISVTGGSDTDREQQITLAPNGGYFAGAPNLGGFNILIYRSDDQMISAFEAKQINAMSGLDSVPATLAQDASLQIYHTPLNAIVMAFFNNSSSLLSDSAVRQALTAGVDRSQLPGILGYPPNLARGPLLASQISYTKATSQLSYSPSQARHLLNKAGWKVGAGGQRFKDGHPLTLSLVSENTPDYEAVNRFLQAQWSKLGVKIIAANRSADDLQGNIIPSHGYDILLYGIDIGVDPDVFAYWDSSQASADSQGHSNLSEYKSTAANEALESARTRASLSNRIPKYNSFLRIWRNDAPALALYQPNYLYISRGPVYGFQRKAIDSAADRFYNADQWMIRQRRQTIN